MSIPAAILARGAHDPILLKVRHGRASRAMRHERSRAWQDRVDHVDSDVIELLTRRDGIATSVTLKRGTRLTVHNIAWGYDVGDDHAHVTTNISPEVAGATIDFCLHQRDPVNL